jgi:HdeA/HdeB family protein
MSPSWKKLLVAPCALVFVAAAEVKELDAGKVSCAQFRELGLNRQKRILSFLQGYAHREVAQDKVGSVAIGAGLTRVLDACMHDPTPTVFAKVKELASGDGIGASGEARLTRQPTEMTCKEFVKLDREDRRLTVYWLDGYSRKVDPSDANQSVVALATDPEDAAKNACTKRGQGLWWAIQGGVRSVDPAPADQ